MAYIVELRGILTKADIKQKEFERNEQNKNEEVKK